MVPRFINGSHRTLQSIVHHAVERCLTLSLHILPKELLTVFNEIPAGSASDTWAIFYSRCIWFDRFPSGGYLNTMLFSLSKQTIPATLLLAALLWGGFTFSSVGAQGNASNGQQQENFITFGNLSRPPGSLL